MEIFDLYDINMNKLSNKMTRGNTNNKGEYHLVVHVWIKNNNSYLMQQRNKSTDRFPYQWASCGGAVTSGEDSLHTAQREVLEEMGIDIDLSKFQFKHHFFVEHPFSNYIIALYLVEEEIHLEDLTLQQSEVKRCAYFTLEEIKQKISKLQCWDYEETDQTKDYYTYL